jgi:hypothetical protein
MFEYGLVFFVHVFADEECTDQCGCVSTIYENHAYAICLIRFDCKRVVHYPIIAIVIRACRPMALNYHTVRLVRAGGFVHYLNHVVKLSSLAINR